jgi:hypothetical protein
MGPGHLGVALAAKPAAPDAPLWALLVASETLDLLSGVLMAAGLETFVETQVSLVTGMEFLSTPSVPWSHGLPMAILWSALFAGIAYVLSRSRRASIVLGLVVFSHWVLDFVVHPPDLPLLFAGSPVVGLGLWASPAGLVTSMILEIALLAGGIAIYWNYRKQTTILKDNQ